MKKIIGYVVAYFVGVAVSRWYLTTEDGKEDLAEILEEAGYEYLAREITDGQPLARQLAAFEQQERDARYLQNKVEFVIPERDLELEAILGVEDVPSNEQGRLFQFTFTHNNGEVDVKTIHAYSLSEAKFSFYEWASDTAWKGQILHIDGGIPQP